MLDACNRDASSVEGVQLAEDSLERCLRAVDVRVDGGDNEVSPRDFFVVVGIEVVEELRQAQKSLGEITGQYLPDDLLGAIFSSFCIGK